MFQSLLFLVYSAVFPLFISEEAPCQGELGCSRSKIETILALYPDADQFAARIRMDWLMPVLQPVQWWRHMLAVNRLLEDIGWVDIEL